MHHVHHIFAGVSRVASMLYFAPWAALGVALLPLVGSAADVIDFETIPGGTPADGLAITTQFQATHGVTFSLEGGGSPVLAQVGSPRTAFQGFGLADDTPAPGQNVGQFFLTDDGIVDRNPPALLITYSTPVAAASGVLIDIDGPESWLVQARDANDSVVASVTLTPASQNAGEGLAAPWAFTRPAADIHSIRIAYTGPTNVAVGLAFDNFSSAGGPEAHFSWAEIGVRTLRFDASDSTGTITRYRWDFDDQSPPFETTTPVIDHTFPAADTYNVSLTVFDEGDQSDSDVQQVVVVDDTLRGYRLELGQVLGTDADLFLDEDQQIVAVECSFGTGLVDGIRSIAEKLGKVTSAACSNGMFNLRDLLEILGDAEFLADSMRQVFEDTRLFPASQEDPKTFDQMLKATGLNNPTKWAALIDKLVTTAQGMNLPPPPSSGFLSVTPSAKYARTFETLMGAWGELMEQVTQSTAVQSELGTQITQGPR